MVSIYVVLKHQILLEGWSEDSLGKMEVDSYFHRKEGTHMGRSLAIADFMLTTNENSLQYLTIDDDLLVYSNI